MIEHDRQDMPFSIFYVLFTHFETVCLNPQVPPRQNPGESHEAKRPVPSPSEPRTVVTARGWRDRAKMAAEMTGVTNKKEHENVIYFSYKLLHNILTTSYQFYYNLYKYL